MRKSYGELRLERGLKRYGVYFKSQFRFPDCRNKLPLPFDFAVFDKDGYLTGLIEFDGEQHYKPIPFFGGEQAFKELQYRDEIKDQYCHKNNIELARLPYWEENEIELFLEAFLGFLRLID